MTPTVVHSPNQTGKSGRERLGVLALAGVIATMVIAYLALNSGSGDARRGLLPYQALANSLPDADRQQFMTLREQLVAAERLRAQTSRWPEIDALQLPGSGYTWTRFERGTVTNYFGQPKDASQPAWLLEIQEPEPGTAPDPAPNDEEHHRLPDGTTLHVYSWTHRFGGQVPAAFVPAPQNSGWVEVFSEVPNPVYVIKR